jgi:16S rRNA processing protein RimM
LRSRRAIRRSDAPLPGTGAGRSRTAPRAAEKPWLVPAAPDKTRVCVARVGAAHGTNGEVKLWSFTAEREAVACYGAVETADGARSFEIEALRPAGDYFIARLKGVTDRAAAGHLRNLDLYVPRARLPAPQPDEFYHADLIGLAVEDGGGTAVGSVIAVHNFGAGDILEIGLAEGGDTLMLPFTAAVVPKVDVAAGRIVLDPSACPIVGTARHEAQPRKTPQK